VRGILSLPVLLALAWLMAGVLWWDRRRAVIPRAQVPWTMAAMVLVVLAMALAIVSVPAPLGEQALRGFLLIEAGYGFWALARRHPGGSRDER
jgi:uncharacterized iron-regulated membrane protein